MAEYDFNAPRLFVDAPLQGRGQDRPRPGAGQLPPERPAPEGRRDGPGVQRPGRRVARGGVGRRAARPPISSAASGPGSRPGRPTSSMPSRPLKHARLDYMVQKAVEMGAGVLQPVLTRRTQSTRVNLERMRSNAIEAAEQCGILSIPEVREEKDLEAFYQGLGAGAAGRVLRRGCARFQPCGGSRQAWEQRSRLAVIVGPEGGFTDQERALVAAHERCVRVSLGPRILRADTAAVAALARRPVRARRLELTSPSDNGLKPICL